MRRREFITFVGGALAWPLAARGQQQSMPVIGFLHTGTPGAYTRVVVGFRQGLKEAGFVEGQNVAIEFRWANAQLERLPELADDLIQRQVAVILAGGGAPSAVAAKTATKTIPIVVAFGSDPIKLGLVTSLNRPGGNITGATFITTQLMGKRLEILSEMVPKARTIGFLYDPRGLTAEDQKTDVRMTARALGRQVIALEVRSDRDFEPAFATLIEHKADALLVGAFPLLTSQREKLLTLAARYKVPAIYPNPDYTLDGGLMSYGPDIVDVFRQGGIYVGQILLGTKPADLAFQQTTKFRFVINLKTVKALGLDLPQSIVLRADEVIE